MGLLMVTAPDAALRGHHRELSLRVYRFFPRGAAVRHRRRRQGAAAPPERGATVPHRTAMTALCRVGGALAALLSTVTVGAAAPHDAAFVAWAKAHAVPLPDCASNRSGADYRAVAGALGEEIGRAHV